jgi:hypothetical protein
MFSSFLFIFSLATNDWLCDVPANSARVRACSEFARARGRWHERIAFVSRIFYFPKVIQTLQS